MEEYANLSLSFSSFPNHPLRRVLLYYFILVGPIGKTNAKTDNFLPEQMTSYPDFTMGGGLDFITLAGPATGHGLFPCWTQQVAWLRATWTNQI